MELVELVEDLMEIIQDLTQFMQQAVVAVEAKTLLELEHQVVPVAVVQVYQTETLPVVQETQVHIPL